MDGRAVTQRTTSMSDTTYKMVYEKGCGPTSTLYQQCYTYVPGT